MTILILSWRDLKHPMAGGAEVALFEHAKIWKRHGARIVWYSAAYPRAKKKEEIGGMQIIRGGSQYTVYFYAFFYYMRYLRTEVDVVIDNFHGVPFFSKLYINNKKIIAFIHEVAREVWFYNLPKVIATLGYSLEPLIFNLYKNTPFITVSESTKKDLVRLNVVRKNIHIITNGISEPNNNNYKKSKRPVILYLGRLAKDKGIFDAIETFTLVGRNNKTAQFWVVGKEEKKGVKDNLIKMIPKDMRKRIIFFNFVSERKKTEILHNAWILLHPSIREGWGLTVIEANCCGTPVIGYDVPGLRDSILHGKTGILTKSKSPSSLAGEVVGLISNHNKYQQYSREARKWSKKFDWNIAGKKSWKLIKYVYEKNNS